jgi:hypothetical protein
LAELQQLIDSGNLDQLDNMVSEFAREFVSEEDSSHLKNNNNNSNSSSTNTNNAESNLKPSNNNPSKLVH